MSVRKSKKRDAVIEVLRAARTHPSARTIYDEAKKIEPDLSLGTVYRNLTAFKKEGVISSVGFVAGEERFDFVTEPHAHFVCTGCGCVIDVDLCGNERDFDSIEKSFGARVTGCSVVYRGLCAHCLAESNPEYKSAEDA